MWVLLRSRFLCETSDTMLSEPKIGTRSFCRRASRSEEHTSELQSRSDLVCRLLLEKKKRYRSRVGFVGTGQRSEGGLLSLVVVVLRQNWAACGSDASRRDHRRAVPSCAGRAASGAC